jgi:mRNA interferase MazF
MQKNYSNFKQGDIVVAELPFAEQTGWKRRPALVISNSEYNKDSEDLILLKITSKELETKFDVVFNNQDLIEGELSVESKIMVDNPVTTYLNLIDKKIAKLSEKKLLIVKQKMIELYKL